MLDASISQIAIGIEKLTSTIIDMCNTDEPTNSADEQT